MAGFQQIRTKHEDMLRENQQYYKDNKPWYVPKSSWEEKYNDDVRGIKMNYYNETAPDGSPDARRESTWLGTAAKAALIAGMAAPFVGPAIRGIGAAGRGIGSAYKAGSAKSFSKMIDQGSKYKYPPHVKGAGAEMRWQRGQERLAGIGSAGKAIADVARQGASGIAGAGRAAMADPRAALSSVGQGLGRIGDRYRNFYAGGGAGAELNKARQYFGM